MTIWVMMFHALYSVWENHQIAHFPFLYYFMPWFFYKAGMLFRPKDVGLEWKSGLRKLIKTWVIWTAIGYVVNLCWMWFDGDISWRSAVYSPIRSLILSCSMPINEALWFIPVLFLVRGLGNWCLQKMSVVWLVISSLVVSIFICLIRFRLIPVWISGTAWGVFFFAVGYLLKGKETNRWIAIVSAIGFVFSIFSCVSLVWNGGQPMWAQVLWYPSCICGIVSFNNFCRALTYKDKYTWPILTYVGRNAMNFYVPHAIVFHLTFNFIIFFRYEWYGTWIGMVVVSLSYLVVLPLLNLFINYLKRT